MFNNCKTFLLAFLSCFLFANIVVAEETKFRLPNEITEAEWDQIRDLKADYNGCLKGKMAEYVKNGTDARQVANQVLEVCSVHLLSMQKQMDGANIQPEFTQRFIYNTKNKASRQMLGGIMMMMAQQQANQEAAASTESTEKKPE